MKNIFTKELYEELRSKGVSISVMIETFPEIPKEQILSHRINPKLIKGIRRDSVKNFTGRDRTRELVRIRDNHTCQKCNTVWIQGTRRFDIHHLNNACGKRSISYDRIGEIPGLITLCHKCHMNLDHVKEKMSLSIRTPYPTSK